MASVTQTFPAWSLGEGNVCFSNSKTPKKVQQFWRRFLDIRSSFVYFCLFLCAVFRENKFEWRKCAKEKYFATIGLLSSLNNSASSVRGERWGIAMMQTQWSTQQWYFHHQRCHLMNSSHWNKSTGSPKNRFYQSTCFITISPVYCLWTIDKLTYHDFAFKRRPHTFLSDLPSELSWGVRSLSMRNVPSRRPT